MHRVRTLAILVIACAPAVSAAQASGQPLPLPPGARYSIKVDSSPQTAAIYVNDKIYGIQGYTPSTIKLPRGSYRILLEVPGFKPASVNVQVTRSQAFTVNLERAARPALLDVRASSDGNALGATIVVDGTAVGTLPNRVEVGGGNHVVEISKPGFQAYRDNLQIAEGETRTLVVPMQAQARPGSLLVTADAPGAMVYIDGFQKDTAPTVVLDLVEGPHTVEVRAGGQLPWKQVVNVIGGQQSKVHAQLQGTAPLQSTGTLKVLSGTPNADVLLDGEPKGPAGADMANVAPGSHIVEVRAQGYAPQRVPVDTIAGQVKTIQVDLVATRDQNQSAGLRVISPVPDVEVFVDGASVGRAPVTRRDLSVGRHFVVARKPGFADFQINVDLQPGQTQDVLAELRASGGLRVISNPSGASVFLDGTVMGSTPLSLNDVSAGPHVVELKLKDFVDAKQQVTVDAGGQGIVQADLALLQKGPSAAELERTQRSMSSWSANTLERGHFTIDGGAGYPYFLFTRLTTGILRRGQFGFDVGIEVRTSFLDTQVGLRPRVQLIKVDPFALGVDVTIMGGGGPTNRNSFTFEVGPIATLAAGQFVHFSVKPYLGVWSDRLCPSVDDIKSDDAKNGTMLNGQPLPGSGSLYKSDEKEICKAFDKGRHTADPSAYDLPGTSTMFGNFGQKDPRDRFTTVRFMLQLAIEVAVSKSVSVFGMIEGAPFQSERQSFTSKFMPVYTNRDEPALYGRAGVTGKF